METMPVGPSPALTGERQKPGFAAGFVAGCGLSIALVIVGLIVLFWIGSQRILRQTTDAAIKQQRTR